MDSGHRLFVVGMLMFFTFSMTALWMNCGTVERLCITDFTCSKYHPELSGDIGSEHP